jgi:hypothetical protein
MPIFCRTSSLNPNRTERFAGLVESSFDLKNMGPILSLRIFNHPPVSNGTPPILNPLNPTQESGVKMGKCDVLKCERFLQSLIIKNGSFLSTCPESLGFCERRFLAAVVNTDARKP